MVSKINIYLILLLLYAVPRFCIAQEIPNMEEMLIEQLTDIADEEVDLSEVMERLQMYQKNPLNLNTVSEEELADLIFLSPLQVQRILDHRTLTGEFLSLLELQSIRELDFRTIQLLRLFVEIRPSTIWKDINAKMTWKKADQMVLIRYGRVLEKQKGYVIKDETRSHYLGDPNRYSIRYKFNYEDRVRLSLNMEKDAGELFFRGKQSLGFDFYSGHLTLKQVSRVVKQVVIGDYALQFGQGLLLWNGLSFGKGAWISSAARQGRGLLPYSSMNESNFHRGIAATIVPGKKWEITPFVSCNRLSGKVEDISEGVSVITSINYSGLHRTPTEQFYRRAVTQYNYGTNLTYQYLRLRMGVTYLATSFTHPVLPGTALYQRFDFEGKSVRQLGVHYHYTYRNLYLFGEGAHSLGSGVAINQGMLASLHPKVSAVVHYRYYQRNYHAFYAHALGESSKVANESGVYSGLVYHPNRRVEWGTYIDLFKSPWLKYRVDGPGHGIDFLTQFTYSWYKRGSIKMRYRHRLHQENLLLEERHENMLADVIRNQFRIGFQYKLSDRWTVRNRAEWTIYDKERAIQAKGWLVYQDVFWKGYQKKLDVNIRFACFDTDGYNARIYAYENNVLYASGFPLYYDKGIRTYINLRWRAFHSVDLWARYALTKYVDKESVGSGLDQIRNDKKSDVTLQLRWQW